MNPTEEDTSTSTSTAAVDGAAAADAAFQLAAGTVIQVQPDPRPAAAPVPTPPELTYLPKDRINELKELNALEHVASIARPPPPRVSLTTLMASLCDASETSMTAPRLPL